jgi:(1->4)-alpha-D-glucan 1-alpha-D-glucosylmutase
MRLQLHEGFTFADASNLVPYLVDLGISHVYSSPILTARAGSSHGYDVVDPTSVNPELGGTQGFRDFVGVLHAAGLGLIVDIVPNHMAATVENPWWADVLRYGLDSRYARSFDIDWASDDPELRGKLFLPVLGRPLQAALDAGEIVPTRCNGQDYLRYGDVLLPARGSDPGRQAYRLGWWRTTGDRLNWRRFFDINDLVCLRMDDEETFENVHALTARLYTEGTIDGVRVDHIDGLSDPAGYCRKLRRRLDPKAPSRPYLVVEKILLRGETLPLDWDCDGTTGYDFMDQVSALQHDSRGEPQLDTTWAMLSGRAADFAGEEKLARREIIARSFSAQLEACVAAFARFAKADPAASDLSRPAIRRVLVEMLVHFPVYRSYGIASDRPFLEHAVRGAKTTGLASDHWVVDLLHRWMRDAGPDSPPVTRFRQLSAPIAAKSVEDTAFYRYGRLLSRNDVGFDVERFSASPADFHAWMLQRQAQYPHAMLATATHDHKRGEDLRARLAVLSERARAWTDRASRWIDGSTALRTGGRPAAADIAMLLQMIVGAWPLELALEDSRGRAAFARRLAGWQEKALREAKLRTSWTDPDRPYEDAARAFVMNLVGGGLLPDLLADIFAFVQEIAGAGAVNSLAQLLLKLTAPGVPDLYQGTDDWDFSLVDPDNRRPVDFASRRKTLGTKDILSSCGRWRDGGLKQAIIARVLALRRVLPEVFLAGTYEPVAAEGSMAEHVLAFVRRHGDEIALTVVPRLPTPLLAGADQLLLDADSWQGTALRFSENIALTNLFDPGAATLVGRNVAVHRLLSRVPIGLFSTRQPQQAVPQFTRAR